MKQLKKQEQLNNWFAQVASEYNDVTYEEDANKVGYNYIKNHVLGLEPLYQGLMLARLRIKRKVYDVMKLIILLSFVLQAIAFEQGALIHLKDPTFQLAHQFSFLLVSMKGRI